MLRRNFSRALGMAAVVLALGLSAPPVLAQSLDELRASGAVGERYDGYAQALQSSAVGGGDQVNANRRQIYAQRASQQGVPIDQVGRVYAAEIMRNAPPGTWFQAENGQWGRK